MRELGDSVGSVTSRMAHSECPRTRSALVVFEDGLEDNDLDGLVVNLQRLCIDIDERMVGQRAQLEQFATDLRKVDDRARVQVFRDAYAQRRRTARQ